MSVQEPDQIGHPSSFGWKNLRRSSLLHLSASILPGTCFEDCCPLRSTPWRLSRLSGYRRQWLDHAPGFSPSSSHLCLFQGAKRSANDPGCLRWVSLTILRHIDRSFERRVGMEGTVADAWLVGSSPTTLWWTASRLGSPEQQLSVGRTMHTPEVWRVFLLAKGLVLHREYSLEAKITVYKGKADQQ